MKASAPNSQPPHIAGGLFLEKGTNLLNLGTTARGVEEEVAELAAVGLDVNSSLGGPGIALEHENLVLGPTFLLNCVHCATGELSSLATEACLSAEQADQDFASRVLESQRVLRTTDRREIGS